MSYHVKFLLHACSLVLRNMNQMGALTFGYAPGNAVVIENNFKNRRLDIGRSIDTHYTSRLYFDKLPYQPRMICNNPYCFIVL